ncbi:hypothetical protein KC345_g110 [Hortaea werneckii]|nr:hypothetical protein KC345_g110 [Hortaea werneckii]
MRLAIDFGLGVERLKKREADSRLGIDFTGGGDTDSTAGGGLERLKKRERVLFLCGGLVSELSIGARCLRAESGMAHAGQNNDDWEECRRSTDEIWSTWAVASKYGLALEGLYG